MTWMITASGQQVDLRCIALDTLRIEDIAHHLALINRWAGATSRPYSVAEHSLLVVEILEREHGITSPGGLLAGLLHDAHEAYCGDLSSPMKAIIGNAWHDEEQRIQHAVRSHFGILAASAVFAAQIKAADLQALATEWRDLIDETHPVPADMPEPLWWRTIGGQAHDADGWELRRDAFLARFEALAEARDKQAAALAPAPEPAAPDQHAERLGETLRLATQIADDSTRADIESFCSFERMGAHTWYDTESPDVLHGPDEAEFVATALRYLRLRGHLVTHPTQAHLVRVER